MLYPNRGAIQVYLLYEVYIYTYIYVCLLMCFSLYNFLFVQIGLYAASLIHIGHVLKFILDPSPLRLIVVIESRLFGSFREFFSHRRSHVAYFVAHLLIDHVLLFFGYFFYDQLLIVFLFIFRYFCLTCRLWRLSIAVVYYCHSLSVR